MHTVAVVSGGMDSVTLAYKLANDGDDLTLISFDYGQRHRKELAFAATCAERLGATHEIADLTSINRLLAGSSLTSDEIEVPDGHYAEESMKITVVPNRRDHDFDRRRTRRVTRRRSCCRRGPRRRPFHLPGLPAGLCRSHGQGSLAWERRIRP